MPVARISRATSGGRPEASGGGGGGSPSVRGATFEERDVRSVARAASSSAEGPDPSDTSELIAQPVGQAGLAQQLVELGPMLLRHLIADVGDRRVDIGALEIPPGHGDPDRPHQRVRHRKCVRLGDIEPVQQAISDQIEVPGHRLTGLAVERAQRRQHLAGVVVGREQLACLGIPLERGDQPLELGRGASGDGCRAAHQAEQFSRRHVRPIAHVREEIPGRDNRRGRVAHVLRDHRRMVVAATRQILDQLLVGEAAGIDRLQRAVRLDRVRLDRLVPVAKLLSPELALHHLRRALEAGRDLLLGERHHRAVAEPVDVGRSQRVDQHPVEACEVAGAAPVGRRMNFRPVARHRPRDVHGVALPEAWRRRLESQLRHGICVRHGAVLSVAW
jgi:hypothetical protein